MNEDFGYGPIWWGGFFSGAIDRLAESLEDQLISDALLAKNEKERNDIWLVREESFLIDKKFPGGCWFDLSIPLGKLDAFVCESSAGVRAVDPELQIYVMGHLGDGNLNYAIAKDTPIDHLYPEISEALYGGLAEIGGLSPGLSLIEHAAVSLDYPVQDWVEMVDLIARATGID